MNNELLINNDINNINRNVNLNIKEKKFNIAPLAILNSKIIECYRDFIIYNGCKFNLTTRKNDIKKEYRDNKNYIIYSCMLRRKD